MRVTPAFRFLASACLCLWLCCLNAASAQTKPKGVRVEPKEIHRWALLIGVNDYAEATDLSYCGADMRALREQLIANGFADEHIILLHDDAKEKKYLPMKLNIERQLGIILNLVERGDVLVMAFSGHGVQLGGTSYLCPTEARIDEPETLVSLDAVYQQLNRSAATLKLVMVDACRNDPQQKGQKNLVGGTRQFAEAIAREKPPEGLLLLNSCTAGETSWEEQDFGHGVFMHFVIEGLKGTADANEDGKITLSEMSKYAADKTKAYVARKFNGSQRPFLRGDLTLDALNYGFFDGDTATAWFSRAQTAFNKSEYESSENLLNEAIKRSHVKKEPLFQWRGFARLRQAHHKQAIDDFLMVLNTLPDDAPALRGLGESYFATSDFKKAIASLSMAIQVEPKESRAYYLRAKAFRITREYRNSKRDIDTAIKLEQNKNIAYFSWRAELLREVGLHKRAAADLEQIVRHWQEEPLDLEGARTARINDLIRNKVPAAEKTTAEKDNATATQRQPALGGVPVPTGDEIYDALMSTIEPELLTVNIPKLDGKYLTETLEQRATRSKRYTIAYARYDVAYCKWIGELEYLADEYVVSLLKAAIKTNAGENRSELFKSMKDDLAKWRERYELHRFSDNPEFRASVEAIPSWKWKE